jgi:hypothetical protein
MFDRPGSALSYYPSDERLFGARRDLLFFFPADTGRNLLES